MVASLLQQGERLDDLLTRELRIIQSDDVFSFSMDAVLLAHFCSIVSKGRVLDLCTGNGVIPLLLSTRTKAHITGVEIQERLANMAQRSVQLNGLDQQISIDCIDLNMYPAKVGHGVFDMITVNPPYLPANTGRQNMNEHVAIARHEIHCTLEEVIATSSKLVRYGGKVAMIHRPARLLDLLLLCRRYRLEPKRIRFVHPRLGEEANMVLVEAAKDGKPDMRLLPPLIVYDEHNQYVDELLHIYYGQR